jgi:hypothetical protein
MSDLLAEIHRLALAQQSELKALRQELQALRQEVATLKLGRPKAKPESVQTVLSKAPMSSRELSRMMFVSWASRQALAFDGEPAEDRQRRLLPAFEASNNCRVLGVEKLR